MCEKFLTLPASDASCHAETQAKHLTSKKKDPSQAQDDECRPKRGSPSCDLYPSGYLDDE